MLEDQDQARSVSITGCYLKHHLGAKYLVFVSSHSLKTREFSFAQFGNFLRLFEESVFIFQFLNDKIHNYVKQNIIVNFIIQKLKNKHTFLKKLPN